MIVPFRRDVVLSHNLVAEAEEKHGYSPFLVLPLSYSKGFIRSWDMIGLIAKLSWMCRLMCHIVLNVLSFDLIHIPNNDWFQR